MTTLTLVQAKNGIIVLPNAGDMFHSLDSALVFTSVDDFATYLRAALNQNAPEQTVAAPAQTVREQLSAIAADLGEPAPAPLPEPAPAPIEVTPPTPSIQVGA